MENLDIYTCLFITCVAVLIAIKSYLRAQRIENSRGRIADQLMDERKHYDTRITNLTGEITRLLHDKIYSEDQSLRNHFANTLTDKLHVVAAIGGRIVALRKMEQAKLLNMSDKIPESIHRAGEVVDVAYEGYKDLMLQLTIPGKPVPELIALETKVNELCKAFYEGLVASGLDYKTV